MTVKELYSSGLKNLKSYNIDDAEFDCNCLFTQFVGYDNIKRILNADEVVGDDICESFLSAVTRRAGGEPLQYILGSWEFMGYEFSVGEGVLIPRPETELIVEKADAFIKAHRSECVYDLCAGSGAIGLSLAKLNPKCKFYLFEKYDGALKYLEKNKDVLGVENVEIICCDIFDGCPDALPKPDVITSNPPYINSGEIASLQSEVLKEPLTALDGGNDGLDFYRCISDKWFGTVNKGGTLIMECGDGQSDDILRLFVDKSSDNNVFYDFNNIDRVVQINV